MSKTVYTGTNQRLAKAYGSACVHTNRVRLTGDYEAIGLAEDAEYAAWNRWRVYSNNLGKFALAKDKQP